MWPKMCLVVEAFQACGLLRRSTFDRPRKRHVDIGSDGMVTVTAVGAAMASVPVSNSVLIVVWSSTVGESVFENLDAVLFPVLTIAAVNFRQPRCAAVVVPRLYSGPLPF